MKRTLSIYPAFCRRLGRCSTAVGGELQHEKPLLNRSENVPSLVTSKGGRCYDQESLDTIANRALQAQLQPKNRKTIVGGFSHQGCYLCREMHGAHTQRLWSQVLHLSVALQSWGSGRGSYQSHRAGGTEYSETHFLLEKWGAETAPSSGLGQVLCSVRPLLQVYFPMAELSTLHEAFSRKCAPWKTQAT